MIEKEGGIAAIKIDEGLRSFSGDVIARACFGSNQSESSPSKIFGLLLRRSNEYDCTNVGVGI